MKRYSKKGLEKRKAETFISNRGELIYIIEYIDCNNCTVQFEDGTVLYERKYYDIKKGHIKNPNYPLVYGVGYVGEGVFSFKKNKREDLRESTSTIVLCQKYRTPSDLEIAWIEGCVCWSQPLKHLCGW